VVVDDAYSEINQVVRGADLLSSTPRQIYLHACLGTPAPKYVHLPLALNPLGKKLSKAHGATGIDAQADAPRLLSEALRFLGQQLPDELFAAPPAEQLAWAVINFDCGSIPTEVTEQQVP